MYGAPALPFVTLEIKKKYCACEDRNKFIIVEFMILAELVKGFSLYKYYVESLKAYHHVHDMSSVLFDELA